MAEATIERSGFGWRQFRPVTADLGTIVTRAARRFGSKTASSPPGGR